MTSLTCSVDGCERPKHQRGYCSRHYYKVWKYGDPHAGGVKYKTPEESFAARTRLDPETGCLLWTATTNGTYGLISVGCGKEELVHRYAWARVNGPIPAGMVIDHTCRNKLCARAEHLRPATYSQNGQNTEGRPVDNTSGFLGVSFDKSRGKYMAYVQIGKRMKNLGRYATAEEAAEIARLARLEHYTHNDHDRAA